MTFTQELYKETQSKLDYLNNILQEHKAYISGLQGKVAGLLSSKAELKLPDALSFNGYRKVVLPFSPNVG